MASVAAVVAMVAVALAGCAGDGEANGVGPEGAGTLAAGTGGIAGLLVDDRFRPLHLNPDPEGPYARDGFLLVQETGDRLRTDADGVFRLAGVAPGTYTLRPNVPGHEGTSQEVAVRAGEFTESTVVVRRLASEGEATVVVYDTTVLMTCMSQTGNVYGTYGSACFGDFSGDSEGSWVSIDLSEYETVAAIVFEFEFPSPDDWSLSVHPAQGSVSAVKYAIFNVFDVDYTKHIMIPGESYSAGALPGEPFDPHNMEVWIRRNHAGAQETYAVTGEAAGVGFTFQAKARSVMSVFLQMPDDLEGYALLA